MSNSILLNQKKQNYDVFRSLVDGSITSIDIPFGTSSIKGMAFYNCKSITSIKIPNTVTKIDVEAFYNCESLSTIEIPNTVTSIGNRSFVNCKLLTSIEIPSSVTSIGNSAFARCTSLSSVKVLNPTPPKLGTSVFYTTPPNLVIYVPASSVSAYQTAWNEYSSKIQSIS